MSGFLCPLPLWPALNLAGAPAAGGKLYARIAGTGTLADTFTTAALTTPNTNPVILSASGRANVFIPDASVRVYDFVLNDSDDVLIQAWDSISIPDTSPAPTPPGTNTGDLIFHSASDIPDGYLVANGSAVSRVTYSDLFDLYNADGLVFGVGDGVSTFNIPDMRGVFPLGQAAAGTGSTLGAEGGAIDHVHTGPSHTHVVDVPFDGWTTQENSPPLAGILQAGGSGTGAETTVTQANADQSATSGAGGTGNTGTANPPFLACPWLVKT